jgi:hypothetical protein
MGAAAKTHPPKGVAGGRSAKELVVHVRTATRVFVGRGPIDNELTVAESSKPRFLAPGPSYGHDQLRAPSSWGDGPQRPGRAPWLARADAMSPVP